MIVNQKSLLKAAPIKDMLDHKVTANGLSYGLTEIGYDIRLAETITIKPKGFVLASAIEEFDVPPDLVGRVCDKSTWARKGISVFNTMINPGWSGFLTLEIANHGEEPIHIISGTPIAQIIFECLVENSYYTGKYQNQEHGAQTAR